MSQSEQTSDHTAQTPTFQEKAHGNGGEGAPKASLVDLKNFDRFLDNINGIMAAKENLKLCAIHKNLNRAYYKKWSREANLHFTLAVSLRKRRKKLADKS